MRIGIGLGAFADGFLRGVGTGRQLKGIRDERELETIRKEGLGEARAQRDAAIDQNIMTLPDAEGAPEQYQVGDQTFTDQNKAREVAGQSVGSTLEFWMNGPADRYYESLVEKGLFDRADAFTGFRDRKRGKAALKGWGQTMASLQVGDFDAAGKHFGNYYSKYIDPNMEYLGHDVTKSGDQVTGLVVRGKNKETGQTVEMPLTREDMIQYALQLNPQTLFERELQQMDTVDKARLSDAADARKYQRQQQGRIDLEVIKGQIRDANERAKFDRNIQVLQRAGYDQAFINSVIPSLIGADTSGPYRKGRSPEETVTMLHEKRLENDYEYNRMSQEERREAILNDMQMIREIAETVMQSQPQPSQQGGQPAGPQQGVPVLDTRTGQMIYR